MKNRHSTLSDPNYESGLIKKITEDKIKLSKYEEIKRNHGAKQSKRGKELENVLDTGEKAELYKEFDDLNKELAFIMTKYEKLKSLNEKTCQGLIDVSENTKKFENELEKLKDPQLDLEKNKEKDKNTDLSKNLSALQRSFENAVGRFTSQKISLNRKIQKLEDELEKASVTETTLKKKLEALTGNYKSNLSSINNLREIL